MDLRLCEEILSMKEQKSAIILSHYYQIPVIQEIADFVGDSLELSRKATETDSELIVFAGVRFMGETAKILNPTKKVLIPDIETSCSLADSCKLEELESFLKDHSDHVIVSYINCTADIKAISDFVCTSTNAIKVIESIPSDKKIIFIPDKNLGSYIIGKTGRDMILWDGECHVHKAISRYRVADMIKTHKNAKFIAHPECSESLLKLACFVGSTTQLLEFVQRDNSYEFIVATEEGILHKMRKAVPDKVIIPAPTDDHISSCCEYMKLNTLEKLHRCLDKEIYEITIPENIREKAYQPIKRMLELS